jgi:Ran GTPase-activating protein (RanGAP) involved in mRNA processing and transport
MAELYKINQGVNSPEAMEALGRELIQNPEVICLRLCYNDIGTQQAIEALGVALQDTNVTSLDLSGNLINTPEAMDALRGLLLKNPQITSLNLAGNLIKSPEAISALGMALYGTNVSSLSLNSNRISSWQEMESLGELLQLNPQIISLDLGCNNIKYPATIEGLVWALSESNVRRLNLRGNRIGDPSKIEVLGEALRGNNISIFSLAYNGIKNPETINALGGALQGASVSSLDLSNNGISSPQLMEALGNLLRRNLQICRLSLAESGIVDPAAIAVLGEALRVANVTSLDLGYNDIKDPETISALGMALHGTNVTSLDLSHNQIESPEAIDALRELLRQNPQITSLDLSHTDLPIDVLLSLVMEFSQLHHVGIDGDRPGIAEQLRFNRALQIKAVVRTLWREKPKMHPDAFYSVLEFTELTEGLNINETYNLIEAAAPAFNFQLGNFPHAISFAPVRGGRPRISITFESIGVLGAFLENNGNTFRMLRALGAAVGDSGNGVEIIAPDAKIGTPLRIKLEAIRDELISLKIKLGRRRGDSEDKIENDSSGQYSPGFVQRLAAEENSVASRGTHLGAMLRHAASSSCRIC